MTQGPFAAPFFTPGAAALIPPALGPIGAVLVVPNVAALIAYAASPLTDGRLAWVQTLRAYWVFSPNAGTPTNGISCVATSAGGVTRWLRTGYADPSWGYCTDAYVDSVAGNDENQGIYNGTPGAPLALKTFDELRRRWLDLELNTSDAGHQIRVHVLNGGANAGVWRPRCVTGFSVAVLRLLGENTTVLKAGTLAAVGGFTAQTPNGPAGGGANIITDAAGGSFAAYVKKRIRFTATGAQAIILKDLGGGSARISTPLTNNEATFSFTPVITNPANGAAYEIVEHTAVMWGSDSSINMRGSSTYHTPGFLGQASNLLIDVPSVGWLLLTGPSYYPQNGWHLYNCDYAPTVNYNGTASYSHSNCSWRSGFTVGDQASAHLASSFRAWGGAVFTSCYVVNGANQTLDYYFAAQGATVSLGGWFTIGTIQVWDAVASSFLSGSGIDIGWPSANVWYGARGEFRARAGLNIWGSGNAGYGVMLQRNCAATISPIGGGVLGLNITGALGDIGVMGDESARYFDQVAGAYSVGYAKTWAVYNLAQGAGGVGGEAHFPGANAHLVQAA